MKYYLISFLLLAFATNTFSQTLPPIETENLNGKTVHLPTEKGTLIGLAFSQKAQNDLVTWLEPIYKQFLDPDGTGAWVYDCNTYLLLAFTGAKQAAAEKAKKEIKKATERDFFNYVLMYEGNIEPFKNLDVKDKSTFYILVIDENGNVLVQQEGAYSERKLDALSLPLEQ
tara:strand:+ start:193 stop:705 length:513 start_codon:yes stop_codon:yes gene_type:complete